MSSADVARMTTTPSKGETYDAPSTPSVCGSVPPTGSKGQKERALIPARGAGPGKAMAKIMSRIAQQSRPTARAARVKENRIVVQGELVSSVKLPLKGEYQQVLLTLRVTRVQASSSADYFDAEFAPDGTLVAASPSPMYMEGSMKYYEYVPRGDARLAGYVPTERTFVRVGQLLTMTMLFESVKGGIPPEKDRATYDYTVAVRVKHSPSWTSPKTGEQRPAGFFLQGVEATKNPRTGGVGPRTQEARYLQSRTNRYESPATNFSNVRTETSKDGSKVIWNTAAPLVLTFDSPDGGGAGAGADEGGVYDTQDTQAYVNSTGGYGGGSRQVAEPEEVVSEFYSTCVGYEANDKGTTPVDLGVTLCYATYRDDGSGEGQCTVVPLALAWWPEEKTTTFVYGLPATEARDLLLSPACRFTHASVSLYGSQKADKGPPMPFAPPMAAVDAFSDATGMTLRGEAGPVGPKVTAMTLCVLSLLQANNPYVLLIPGGDLSAVVRAARRSSYESMPVVARSTTRTKEPLTLAAYHSGELREFVDRVRGAAVVVCQETAPKLPAERDQPVAGAEGQESVAPPGPRVVRAGDVVYVVMLPFAGRTINAVDQAAIQAGTMKEDVFDRVVNGFTQNAPVVVAVVADEDLAVCLTKRGRLPMGEERVNPLRASLPVDGLLTRPAPAPAPTPAPSDFGDDISPDDLRQAEEDAIKQMETEKEKVAGKRTADEANADADVSAVDEEPGAKRAKVEASGLVRMRSVVDKCEDLDADVKKMFYDDAVAVVGSIKASSSSAEALAAAETVEVKLKAAVDAGGKGEVSSSHGDCDSEAGEDGCDSGSGL